MKRYSVSILVIAAMVFGFAMSANAASFKAGDVDLSISGSVRFDMGYEKADFGDVAADKEDSKTDFFADNPGDSRVGFGAAYNDVSAFVELGLGGDDAAFLRLANFTYTMNENASLTVGRDWVIFAEGGPAQWMFADLGLDGYGDKYAGRDEQIRYNYNAEDYGFAVALQDTKDAVFENAKVEAGVEAEGTAPELVGVESRFQQSAQIPAVVANFSYYGVDGLNLVASAFVQQYEMTAEDVDFKDLDVLSWGLALDAAYEIEDLMTVSGSVWYTVNDGRAYINTTKKDELEDVADYGVWLQASVPVDELVINAGVGYQVKEYGDESTTLEDETATMGYFVNAQYNVTDNFFVVPEIAYLDKGDARDDKTDQGYEAQAGIHFQFNF